MSEMFPAVFMDRDGVLCREKSYVTSVKELEVYPFALEAVTILKNAGWKTIVVTNQSAVARGMLAEEDLRLIHKEMLKLLPVDGIYYCPHYYPGGEPQSRNHFKCDCRKPEPGMILKAARDENIDLGRSFMVGDRASDILAGKKAGLKTVLVETGYGSRGLELDVKPDWVYPNIKDFAIQLIKKKVSPK